jgi:uncharacterized protein YjbI with pentapeptide repeats
MDTKAKVAIKPPVLPAKDTAPILSIILDDESEHANFVLSQCDLSSQNSRFVIVESAWLKQVRFNNCQLTKLRLSDVRLEQCDMSNAQWLECKINRVEIVDCKLTGFRMIDADASDCRFQNCIGELVQSHGSTFKKTAFKDCQLKGADFRFCNLEGATFSNCDLRDAEFYNAKLSGTDFRSSELMGIKAQPEDLKGAIIDSDQASALGRHFASLLGLVVKES